jgi:hypothetical protein
MLDYIISIAQLNTQPSEFCISSVNQSPYRTYTCKRYKINGKYRKIGTLELDIFAQYSSWLRHCATNRKVAGSIPDGVTGIFQ